MNPHSQALSQIAAALAGKPEVESKVFAEITRNSLVSCLLNFRVSRGLTQEQVAKRMGCDPSKVSRMESGNDDGLKWPDIVSYIQAVNVTMSILFEDPLLPAAEQIKQCVFSIKENLDELTELARSVGGNDEIARKIHQFSGEVLINFLIQYKEHSEQLRSVLKISSNPDPLPIPATCGELPPARASESLETCPS
jgi:transcriptional regulator with XRE-family HTH domain